MITCFNAKAPRSRSVILSIGICGVWRSAGKDRHSALKSRYEVHGWRRQSDLDLVFGAKLALFNRLTSRVI